MGVCDRAFNHHHTESSLLLERPPLLLRSWSRSTTGFTVHHRTTIFPHTSPAAMLHLLQFTSQRFISAQCLRSSFVRRSFHSQTRAVVPRASFRPFLWGSAVAITTALALSTPVHADSEPQQVNRSDVTSQSAISRQLHPTAKDILVDPASSIAFPNTLKIPSKSPLPELTLLGVGVRTVSFLGIHVYSVGLYADLQNPSLNVSAVYTTTIY